jgi:hypothetical protein
MLRELANDVESALADYVEVLEANMSDEDQAAWKGADATAAADQHKGITVPMTPPGRFRLVRGRLRVTHAPVSERELETRELVKRVRWKAESLRRLLDHYQQTPEPARAASSHVANPPIGHSLTPSAIPWKPSSAAKAAALPFGSFLIVAGVGALVSPTAVRIIVAVLVLVAAVLAASFLVWVMDRRASAIRPLAAGAALPVFTAAYLLSSWIDDQSIRRSVGPSEWEPMGTIGEAAFLALTVNFGGGTLRRGDGWARALRPRPRNRIRPGAAHPRGGGYSSGVGVVQVDRRAERGGARCPAPIERRGKFRLRRDRATRRGLADRFTAV